MSATVRTVEGSAGTTPWSGNWQPMHEDVPGHLYDDGAALDLYDQYVLKTRGYDPGAQDWEYANHRTTGDEATWAGSCHAVAAASILVDGPPAAGIDKGGIHFSQDALEGLVTALYYEPEYVNLPGGERSYTDDVNAAEYKDMNPAWMHYLLDYYLTDNHHPFIMDTAAGAQVWNYPVFAYRSDATKNADGSTDVKTRVWYTDAQAGVEATKHFYKDYTYRLTETADGRMDGAWTGTSITDHPDFAWVPTGRQEGGRSNPNIDLEVVEEILGYDIDPGD